MTQKNTTPTRFELARAEPIGFQNQLLNHSDTVPFLSVATKKQEKPIKKKVPCAGIEPATNRLKVERSTKLS